MQTTFVRILTIITLGIVMALSARAEDEVSLFNNTGKAEAYIAVDDRLTIYLWSGKPVAYLEGDDRGGYHVYGLNGKHLGWFDKGVIWDHTGNASCAVKEVLKSTEYESYKKDKQYKPYKSYKKKAPYRPSPSKVFGDIPCRILLSEGGK